MFSIIIPLFNKAPFIQRAIDSVLHQEFKSYEIIVVNDGSMDGGGDLVSETYGTSIRLFNQVNSGVSVARNQGILQAKFPWIAFLDADDYWHPQYLAFMARVISENPETGIIGAHYDSVSLTENPNLKYLLLKNYFRKAVRNTYFFTSATVVKKEFFDKKPGFDPELKLGEDIDVWLRATLFFGDGLYLQNTLVFYGSEDAQRATQKEYLLEETLIPKIIEKDYYQNSIGASLCSISDFEAFRDKWTYFTLFPHFRNSENKIATQLVLRKLGSSFFLASMIYKLPFGVLQKIFSNKSFSKLFRNYLKFCLRFIYT